MSNWQIIEGDCRDVLRSLPERSVHTCVTSPPYFGLRDYGTGEWEGGDPDCDHRRGVNRADGKPRGTNGFHGTTQDDPGAGPRLYDGECGKCGASRVDRQIGLEPIPDEFVAALVAVFREVRRVLRDDGTVWLNLGDSYAGALSNGPPRPGVVPGAGGDGHGSRNRNGVTGAHGAKPKDLLGIPWMVAFALRADGWYLRSDIIWAKPNPMPESVTDRPTKAHEYVFLLSKRATYHYDADAIREANNPATVAHIDRYGAIPGRANKGNPDRNDNGGTDTQGGVGYNPAGRNKRSVWTVATQPYAGAHFATFPPKLIEPCILAGAPERACGKCGAPWVRVVEAGPEKPGIERGMHASAHRANLHSPQRSANGGLGTRKYTTLDFEPSCSHGDGSASGVVLDPFAGAGTTGMVALRHGRSFVGAELSPEYAAMARDRIGTAIRLGFRPPQNGTAPIEGQEALFEI